MYNMLNSFPRMAEKCFLVTEHEASLLLSVSLSASFCKMGTMMIIAKMPLQGLGHIHPSL